MKRVALALALALAGCGRPEAADEPTGGGGGAGGQGPDPCEEAPVITWDSFGEGFLTGNCQPCHASTSLDRHDAPPAITFDDRELALALGARILARAGGDAPTMPPGGGTSPLDRERLRIWLTCWEPGP